MLDAGLVLNKRYRILNSLRSGGFGHAYLAEDQNKPSRPRCVVKQFTYRHDDEAVYQQVAERFFREAAVMESLGNQSDQIPSLFAYFEEDDQLYLVQEWIDGDAFDTFLRPERRLDEDRVRDLLVSLLAVLDLVHSKGFIHRDIKPSNIILRRADNQPVLIDFGVVKELLKDGAVHGTEGISRTIIVGSPGFTAPEQKAGHPIFASDIFSLGMSAISLLAIKGPASLQDPVSGTLRWREHVPDVTPHLATILEKSILPIRTQRFQTAREMLKALLDRPPPPPPSPPPPTADPTAFIEAICQGNIGAVQDFLAKGADVNAKDASGRAPLTAAVESGYFPIVRLLLDKGAELDSRNSTGQTILMAALKLDRTRFYGRIIPCDKIVQTLLDAKADVTAKDNDGRTVLMTCVVSASNKKMLQLLLDKGADIHAKDKEGNTVLHLAIRHDRYYVVPFLLEKGANVNAQDNEGTTPLMLSVQETIHHQIMSVVMDLLAKGADVSLKDKKGWTALLFAQNREDDHGELVEMLKRAGAE